MKTRRFAPILALVAALGLDAERAAYVNFESSHVHPIDLTPAGGRLLAVNTPDATLDVFTVKPDGSLTPQATIPVGLEPVTVMARAESEAWVVNHLSDSVSIVDVDLGTVVRTLAVGDEPTDVVFAAGRAFVAVSQEDAVKVFDLSNLNAAPAKIDLFGSDTRALAVSSDGTKVYAVVLNSGNRTTVINVNNIFPTGFPLDQTRLQALGLNDTACDGPHPPYPPHPPGTARSTSLLDPPNGEQPPVSLIVRWDAATGRWRDDAGQDWTNCLPFLLPDHDLFVIDASTLATTTVRHLGTTLFEVSVNPANGKVYVPNTEARNSVRFEHPLGVQGHLVDNRLTIVDPAAGNAVSIVDLNTHINRASDPAANLTERLASLSQPGMLVWNGSGTHGYLTAIGSRKLFRVSQACLDGPGPDYGACVFGANRAAPDAVVVGEGPTGVALHEGLGRLYVLLRFSNSIALVNASTLTKVDEVPLHNPSSATIRVGRRFLYDGIDTSGHGDAACSSCHVSGNMDELAWDLGNPQGTFVAYGTPDDNVRFITATFDGPVTVPAQPPASDHTGFDPEKGPMATQTLRGMLEPLHWRGDRPTMNAFNKAFVSLMGTRDIGPINGEPAGLTAAQMELFRQFALGIAFPPNPYRNVDDTIPDATVTIPGNPSTGNPAAGQGVFFTLGTELGADPVSPCTACHALPFGAANGKLGGINPGDPETARAGLSRGGRSGIPHSDIKVPHLRNLYEKFGPRFGSFTNPADPPADQKTGFGFIHDGSIPDLGTFLLFGGFNFTDGFGEPPEAAIQRIRDLTLFLLHFPTGSKPAVGQNLTVPAGAPPTGTLTQEALLATLITFGNLADPNRHCELVAMASSAGRERTWYLNGGAPGGLWTTDVAGEPQLTTTSLRQGASGPITFLCATIGSGVRLGADRDEDGALNGSDCNPADPTNAGPPAPTEVTNVQASPTAPLLAWDDQSGVSGPATVYDIAGGGLLALQSSRDLAASTSCLAGALAPASYDDSRPDPPAGDGYYYLVRAENGCGNGGWGPNRSNLGALACSSP